MFVVGVIAGMVAAHYYPRIKPKVAVTMGQPEIIEGYKRVA